MGAGQCRATGPRLRRHTGGWGPHCADAPSPGGTPKGLRILAEGETEPQVIQLVEPEVTFVLQSADDDACSHAYPIRKGANLVGSPQQRQIRGVLSWDQDPTGELISLAIECI